MEKCRITDSKIYEVELDLPALIFLQAYGGIAYRTQKIFGGVKYWRIHTSLTFGG